MGAMVLSLSGIICKVIGAIYRIPLSNILGTQGMGCYQMAYPVYSLLVTASSAGIPVAVSKLVAEDLARGDECGAYEVFSAARTSLAAIGAVFSVLLFVLSDVLARMMGLPAAATALKCIAPSVLFVAVASGYRGYMQGRLLMGATAASQLAEQCVRMAAGLSIAGAMAGVSAAMGAGGAMIGVTISEIAGLAVMMIYHAAKKYARTAGMCRAKRRRMETLGKIYSIALPVTAGACAVAAVSAIDSAMIVRMLGDIGYSQERAAGAYGLLTGFVQPIVNMPAVLSGAVAVSIVPAVAAACARGDMAATGVQSTLAFRLAMLISMPCSAALFVLSEPILGLLYSSLSGEELKSAAYLLRLLSPCVCMLGASQVCSGILQGCGRTVMPVLSTALGALLKVFVGLWLIRIPEINIAGAAIGTLICFLACSLIDVALCRKYAAMKVDIKECVLIPSAACAGMSLIMFIAQGYLSDRWGTVAAVLSGCAVYAIILLAARGIKPEDMRFIPKGDAVERFLRKIRIWR